MTPSAARLTLLAVLPVPGYFLALQWASHATAGGVFEYPLDDPYIHLAMAEQIARGGYGVNPGQEAQRYLSEPRVTFHATDPADAPEIRPLLADWAGGLPRGARFVSAEATR